MSKKSYSGINIQWPISQDIISEKKTIETRTYPIPKKYLGKEIALIETPGKSGKFKARVIAIIKFTHCFKYKSKKEFYSQVNKHCVSKDSIWGWKEKEKWGWDVVVVKVLEKPLTAPYPRGYVFCRNIKV